MTKTACSILLLLVAAFHCSTTLAFTTTRSPGFVPVARSKNTCLRAVEVASSPTSSLSNDVDGECTIQILMSDTGGGHRASANALRDALDVLYPGKFHCDIVDLYSEYGPFWPYDDYPRMYKIMAEYSFLWDLFYHFGETPFGLVLNEFLLETFCFDSFKQCLKRPSGSSGKRADMIVSVHPLCQDVPLKILADLDTNGASRDVSKRKTPFATVVTDLGGAHPTWFNPGVDKCYVPSDVLAQCARDRKVKDTQIVQHGLPIRKGFWGGSSDTKATASEQERSQLREELGLDVDRRTVLVVGGGDGMGGIVDIAKSLGDELGKSTDTAYQMVVVCGNNQNAKDSLSKMDFGSGVKVHVQGFVNNMDEWMKASDALVTKAGPGTIAEASICGLPCMLFSYLPGQEEGNVPYVENSGFGKYSGDPEIIAKTVQSWLASEDTMRAMKAAALEASRPSATLDIAQDLAEMVFAEKRKQQVFEETL